VKPPRAEQYVASMNKNFPKSKRSSEIPVEDEDFKDLSRVDDVSALPVSIGDAIGDATTPILESPSCNKIELTRSILNINVGGNLCTLSPPIFVHVSILRDYIEDFDVYVKEYNGLNYDPIAKYDKEKELKSNSPEEDITRVFTTIDMNGVLYIDEDAIDFEAITRFLTKGEIRLDDYNISFSLFRLLLRQYGVFIPIERCAHCTIVYNKLIKNCLICRRHYGKIVMKKNVPIWTCCRRVADERSQRSPGCISDMHRSALDPVEPYRDSYLGGKSLTEMIRKMIENSDPDQREKILREEGHSYDTEI